MKNNILKALHQISTFTYWLSWQCIKLVIIAPFLLALFLQEDLFLKVSFLLASFPLLCFFISGLAGSIGYLCADKSMKHLYGILFTNLFLTLFGGYGFASITYVLIKRIF